MIVARVKASFFDSPKVIRAVESGKRRALATAGAAIRTTAKRSMSQSARGRVADLSPAQRAARRRLLADFRAGRSAVRPRRIRRRSEPGEPPAAPSSSPLNALVFFRYDTASKSLVVGPVGFRRSVVPRLLEYGGRGVTRDRRRRRVPFTMAPRPYMRPALAANLSRIPEAFRGAVR